METPISKEQRSIYERLAQSVQLAQSQLQLFLSTVLAGAGVNEASVKEVTETAIVYDLKAE